MPACRKNPQQRAILQRIEGGERNSSSGTAVLLVPVFGVIRLAGPGEKMVGPNKSFRASWNAEVRGMGKPGYA